MGMDEFSQRYARLFLAYTQARADATRWKHASIVLGIIVVGLLAIIAIEGVA